MKTLVNRFYDLKYDRFGTFGKGFQALFISLMRLVRIIGVSLGCLIAVFLIGIVTGLPTILFGLPWSLTPRRFRRRLYGGLLGAYYTAKMRRIWNVCEEHHGYITAAYDSSSHKYAAGGLFLREGPFRRRVFVPKDKRRRVGLAGYEISEEVGGACVHFSVFERYSFSPFEGWKQRRLMFFPDPHAPRGKVDCRIASEEVSLYPYSNQGLYWLRELKRAIRYSFRIKLGDVLCPFWYPFVRVREYWVRTNRLVRIKTWSGELFSRGCYYHYW